MNDTTPDVTSTVNQSNRDTPHGNLSLRVRRDLERYIVDHGLQPGSRMPPEPELCALFKVSRTAIREAMKVLEALGVVSIQPGRGTFVRSFDITHIVSNFPSALAFRDKDIHEITEVRRHLEALSIRAAVQVALTTPEHPLLDELVKCVNQMQARAKAGRNMWEEDIRFHRILALLADNRVLLMILELFWALRGSLPMDDSPEALTIRYNRHRELVTAILQGDAKLAIDLNEKHLSAGIMEITNPR